MPELGESVHEGTVSRWLKKEGDPVKEDEPVVEIMTDKVNTELQAPASGVLLKILVPEGENVEVFKPLGYIGQEGEVLDEGGSPAPKSGEPSQAEAPAPAASQVEPAPAPAGEHQERKWFSPVVRAMMKEHGLTEEEVSRIPGSGEGGRVTKADLEAYLASKGVAPKPAAPAEQPAEAPKTEPTPQVVVSESRPAYQAPPETPREQPKPEAVPAGDTETIRLTGLRRAIAEAMNRANSIPSVTTVTEVNVSRLVEFRTANKESFQEMYGVRLTYTPFFIKAATEALLKYPMLNSAFHDDYSITVNRKVNMGVAVALGDGSEGLVVPVIRDCQDKTLVEIAKDLESIASKARSGSLEISDMQGATFSLTNPGSYGALFGTPMIPPGQAGILGTYAIKQTPVAENGMIAVRPIMYLVLSYDHRLVDGALAGMFLKDVRERLERFDFFR
ncbi:MAG: dihydrolipoamide acetyltransferase component of pyruvate dehydrogenase complex [Fimbriimonadales bacterium]|nr:MAG: dihydrolipoamide acetyltransferase component of pyruvate dehydrogenase complex [Fimbriimonadales bacterium]